MGNFRLETLTSRRIEIMARKKKVDYSLLTRTWLIVCCGRVIDIVRKSTRIEVEDYVKEKGYQNTNIYAN